MKRTFADRFTAILYRQLPAIAGSISDERLTDERNHGARRVNAEQHDWKKNGYLTRQKLGSSKTKITKISTRPSIINHTNSNLDGELK